MTELELRVRIAPLGSDLSSCEDSAPGASELWKLENKSCGSVVWLTVFVWGEYKNPTTHYTPPCPLLTHVASWSMAHAYQA